MYLSEITFIRIDIDTSFLKTHLRVFMLHIQLRKENTNPTNITAVFKSGATLGNTHSVRAIS